MLIVKNVSLEAQEEEPQADHRKGKGKKERNWRDKKRELLMALYNCLWVLIVFSKHHSKH